jgi:hypothetical protein
MGGMIICYSKCWPCQFGQHFDPPQWHTWADGDDILHARNTGQPDPSKSRCGCFCATGGEEAAAQAIAEALGTPEAGS